MGNSVWVSVVSDDMTFNRILHCKKYIYAFNIVWKSASQQYSKDIYDILLLITIICYLNGQFTQLTKIFIFS